MPSAGNDSAEDLAAVLGSLLDDVRFSELESALRSVDSLHGAERRRVLSLCRAGARLLELDAADFADLDEVPADLRAEVRAMQFPRGADDEGRGSLDSLVPLYGLMLETLAVHWERRETVHVLLVIHLVAEYLPLLAWETRLGHAADPLRLRPQVTGTLWGTEDCPAPGHRRSAATRVLDLDASSGGGVPPEQWRAYLDRWHARVSDHLRQCALRPGDGRPNPEGAGCDRDCGVIALAGDGVDDLAARMALAADFVDSPVVALRHSAPVGHFFGVPGREEVLEVWDESVTWLCREWGSPEAPGRNPVGGGLAPDEGEALPGLHALLSTVAGRRVGPTRVLERLRDEVATALGDRLDRRPDTPS